VLFETTKEARQPSTLHLNTANGNCSSISMSSRFALILQQ